MSYKIGRGNVAKKSLRFHATVKMVSDYQLVTKIPVAASRKRLRDYVLMRVSPFRIFAHGKSKSKLTWKQK